MQAATQTIPIVFIQVPNPVEMGLVASLARPGGNTTGFTQMSAELDSKRLGLLHEIAPAVSRAGFLVDPSLTPGLQKRFADALDWYNSVEPGEQYLLSRSRYAQVLAKQG